MTIGLVAVEIKKFTQKGEYLVIGPGSGFLKGIYALNGDSQKSNVRNTT